METLGAVLGTFGLLALIVGLVLFVPIRLFAKRRPWAKRLAIGGAVAFVAGLILTPSTDRSAKRPAATTTAAPTNTPSPAASPSPDARPAFVSTYRDLLAAAKPCDDSFSALSDAAQTGSPVATYQAARDGRDACRGAAITIGNLEAPDGVADDVEEAVTEALDTCKNAYIRRQIGMDKAMEVADGDARPSAITDMMDYIKSSQAGVLLCVGEMVTAGQKLGVKMDDLK